MDIRFETTGCRLNQIESESAAKVFVENSFTVSLEPLSGKSPIDEETVLVVINTCAVTQKAEQKDRRIIRLVLEKCPNATVVVTGCYAQLAKDAINKMDLRIACLPGQLKSRLSDVAILLKNEIPINPFDFANKLNNGLFSQKTDKPGFSEDAFKLSTDSFLAHSRASIKIQDGCNCNCTYCTINKARGHSVSLDADKVIERVVQLEKAGLSEVVFTSVNIGQYKGKYKDLYINFSKLLKLCLENTSSIAFRISSLYPEIVDDEFCSVIKHDRVRPHFHISVQSGSDNVLKNMARRYKAQDVILACKKIKEVKENPFLACDIITGFPGETDEDFEQTLALCKECNFAWVHVFPFSARPGTVAFDMKEKIPQSVSGNRASILSSWASENKKKYIESYKGKILSAVLETVKKPLALTDLGNTIYHAVTENFLHCQILAPSSVSFPKPGSSIKVKILDNINEGSKKGGEVDCRAEIIF